MDLVVRLRWWLSRITVADRPSREVLVPAGPDGRPGERLLAPGRTLYAPRLTADGAREDFRVMLDRDGSTLASICLGRVSERGDPATAVRHTLRGLSEHGIASYTHVVPELIADEEALRYRAIAPSGELTEWKLAHDGWLYVIGVLNRGRDEARTLDVARAALSTWRWLPSPS